MRRAPEFLESSLGDERARDVVGASACVEGIGREVDRQRAEIDKLAHELVGVRKDVRDMSLVARAGWQVWLAARWLDRLLVGVRP